MTWPLYVICFGLVVAYLWNANRAISTIPPEAAKLAQKSWTDKQLKEAYERARDSPTDVSAYLFSKKQRRYVVAGGSGLVGGWIVQHLLMRGEDPAAIRIVDLNPPTRPEVARLGIDYVKTDISDAQAVNAAFEKPWPEHVRSLPLTVFHTIAYILAADRNPLFLPPYVKVNVQGTRNILQAAQNAGASCLVATSSASVGLRPPAYFPWPWQRWPRDIYQFLPNAEPVSLDAPLPSFGSCYAWSKAQAEKLVRSANGPSLATGAIRPGHAIYGDGAENPSSVTWDYLRRGGNPTWISNVVANFVYAQNVSIGHLAFEDALLKPDGVQRVGGNAYCVTDPNPPIVYGELYRALMTLAHPSTSIAFPNVPHILMLLLAYPLEQYRLLRHNYLNLLPPITGDLVMLQPATFNMCTLHLIYSDERAKKEIGYNPPITTLEGFARAVKAWNDGVEKRLRG